VTICVGVYREQGNLWIQKQNYNNIFYYSTLVSLLQYYIILYACGCLFDKKYALIFVNIET